MDSFEDLDKGYRLPKPIRQFVDKNKQRVILTFWLYKQFCNLNDFENYTTYHKLPAKDVQQNKEINDMLGFKFYYGGTTCVFRDGRLLARQEPVEKVVVYCDGGRVILD